MWLVGYVDNQNWRWHSVYLQRVSGRSYCTWCKTIIIGTRLSGNEWTG